MGRGIRVTHSILLLLALFALAACSDLLLKEQINDIVNPLYEYSLQWGEFGTGQGQFDTPARVAVDSADNVYVLETGIGLERVQKFSADGTFVTSWGPSVTNPGSIPAGVAPDADNNVYVVAGSHVQKYSQSGLLLLEWGGTRQRCRPIFVSCRYCHRLGRKRVCCGLR